MKCIEKCKTGIAIFLLGAIILSVFPSISQAANTYTFDGCRTNNSYGYRSYTKATGYDSNGYAVNVGVRAYFILNGDDINTTNKIASKIKYGKGGGCTENCAMRFLGSFLFCGLKWCRRQNP